MKKVMLIVLSLFFIFSLVSAAPPVTQVQQFSTGYVIESSPTEYIKQNTDYVLNFFVYNISNGVRAGSSLTCYAYLADSQGNLKAYNNVLFNVSGYWRYIIKAGNFTATGHYPYGIACNSTNLGGANVDYFEVTENGLDNNNFSKVFSLIALLLISGLLFLATQLFSKEQKAIKTLFIMFGLGFIVLTIQFVKTIVDGFDGLMNAAFIMGIVLFLIMLFYFMIMYTKDIFYKLRNAWKTKQSNSFGEVA